MCVREEISIRGKKVTATDYTALRDFVKDFIFGKVLDLKESKEEGNNVVWLKGLEGSGMCKHNKE